MLFAGCDMPRCVYGPQRGVGASVHDGRWEFTADVVRLDGAPQAKAGREWRPNSRLEKVK